MGGMGPETSAHFYSRIIELFQSERKARHNYEFPEMLIHNVPSPDNVEAGVGNDLLPFMVNSANLLADGGMDYVTIPCNSAHVWIQEVQNQCSIPVMNILEETVKAIQKSGISHVLILGTWSTLQYGLYQKELDKAGITYSVPNEDDQKVVTELIMHVCDGTVTEAVTKRMLDLIARYPDCGGVILGCTELPLVATAEQIPIPTFDTLEILAWAAYEYCIQDA